MYPEDFIKTLIEFLKIPNVDENIFNKALNEIKINSIDYLLESRINTAIGNVEEVTESFCSGWAFYISEPLKPAKVNIFVNGKKIGETIANIHRPDIKENLHPTGNCGFVFLFPEGFKLKDTDNIEVIVEKDIISLPINRSTIQKLE